MSDGEGVTQPKGASLLLLLSNLCLRGFLAVDIRRTEFGLLQGAIFPTSHILPTASRDRQPRNPVIATVTRCVLLRCVRVCACMRVCSLKRACVRNCTSYDQQSTDQTTKVYVGEIFSSSVLPATLTPRCKSQSRKQPPLQIKPKLPNRQNCLVFYIFKWLWWFWFRPLVIHSSVRRICHI